ncbi:unnamed protein product [Meganyctiphanes norvegica]|uniref:Apple domain-containing protein n=1 Tax=Meganyctiphanes norvegica TaxID=48144 RepID=A0AAV2SX16_MEGNR
MSWREPTTSCSWIDTYKQYSTSTFEICKKKCIEETDVLCSSIEYNSSNGSCGLSSVRSRSQNYEEPCSADGYIYSEILNGKRDPRVSTEAVTSWWLYAFVGSIVIIALVLMAIMVMCRRRNGQPTVDNEIELYSNPDRRGPDQNLIYLRM